MDELDSMSNEDLEALRERLQREIEERRTLFQAAGKLLAYRVTKAEAEAELAALETKRVALKRTLKQGG